MNKGKVLEKRLKNIVDKYPDCEFKTKATELISKMI